MNRKFVPLIIFLISLALIGLIFIQGIWINQGIKSREAQFDQSVHDALRNVALRVEEAHAARLLMPAKTMSFEQLLDQYMCDFKEVTTAQQFTYHSDSSNHQDIKISIEAGQNGGMHVIKKQISISDSFNQSEIALTFDTSISVSGNSPSDIKKLENNFNRYTGMIQNLALDMMFENQSLSEKINPSAIRPVIETELAALGMDADFNYAVLSGIPTHVIFTEFKQFDNEIFKSAFKIPLFQGDFFGNQGWLMVYFPNRRNYILSSMWMMLAASGLFILIIMLCFIATIFIIFKQKKLSDLKNDFINNMTHELKTPVATISLASEMLQNEKVLNNKSKILNYSEIIKDENKRLSKHIEKVLQAARLETGDVQLKKIDVDMHEIIKDVASHLALRIENEHGSLNYDLKAEKAIVKGDKVHLTNLVYNLLDNSIKYKNGHLAINIHTENSKDGFSFAIKDEGIGMNKDQQKRIFEKFYRVPTGNLHNTKGFGLGLSYVKGMVEAHSGNITVESSPGKGSKFEVFIPFHSRNINYAEKNKRSLS